MVKYVKSISIGDNILEVDDNVTIGQVISVFESLPMKISNEIAENIKKLRKIEIASLSNDVLPEDVQISLDASIFTND
jgi:transcription elongation factor